MISRMQRRMSRHQSFKYVMVKHSLTTQAHSFFSTRSSKETIDLSLKLVTQTEAGWHEREALPRSLAQDLYGKFPINPVDHGHIQPTACITNSLHLKTYYNCPVTIWSKGKHLPSSIFSVLISFMGILSLLSLNPSLILVLLAPLHSPLVANPHPLAFRQLSQAGQREIRRWLTINWFSFTAALKMLWGLVFPPACNQMLVIRSHLHGKVLSALGDFVQPNDAVSGPCLNQRHASVNAALLLE